MKVHHCLQGSDEWIALRLGIPTASAFDRIIAPTGKPSGVKTSEKYMFELLSERITGQDATTFRNTWMERGQTLERDAAAFYELQRGMDTQSVGFITNDEGTAGASPDKLVEDIGMMEIKCPSPGIHIAYLLQHGVEYADYKVQVQGQLMLAEREWCDVVSYHPFMEMALIRIPRDEEFISLMRPILAAFVAKLESMSEELKKRGWLDMPKKEPFDDETHAAFAAWSKGR